MFDEEPNLNWEKLTVIVFICFFQYLHECALFVLSIDLVVQRFKHTSLKVDSIQLRPSNIPEKFLNRNFVKFFINQQSEQLFKLQITKLWFIIKNGTPKLRIIQR